MRRALGTCVLAAAAACGRGEPGGAAAVFELRPVVAPRIAALEAELAAPAAPPPAPGVEPAVSDGELEQRLAGLAAAIAGAQGRWRALYREEVAALGDAATPVLARLAADTALSEITRLGALELLAALDTPLAAERLLALCAGSREAFVRRAAARRLGETSQDACVPGLVLRLKYETDGETVVWLARSLARFGSHAGLDGLLTLQQGAAPDVAALAAAELAEEVAAAGASDSAALWTRWTTGAKPALRAPPSPSARLRLACWRQIEELSGERFQLRGVDDARFVLARGAPWVVELLAEALHDDDAWTRVHVAQCLARMGPRAHAAVPELVRALDEPGCAAAAAEALGAIGDARAVEPLALRLGAGRALELRAAAAHALRHLGAAARPALPALRALLAPGEPLDLRQAAAEALVALGAGDEVAAFLLECLASPEADREAAEAALGAWLASRAAAGSAAGSANGSAAAAEVLVAWSALGPAAPFPPPSPAEVRERQAARHALLARELARLRP